MPRNERGDLGSRSGGTRANPPSRPTLAFGSSSTRSATMASVSSPTTQSTRTSLPLGAAYLRVRSSTTHCWAARSTSLSASPPSSRTPWPTSSTSTCPGGKRTRPVLINERCRRLVRECCGEAAAARPPDVSPMVQTLASPAERHQDRGRVCYQEPAMERGGLLRPLGFAESPRGAWNDSIERCC